jgi:hypothetical protein
MTIAKRPRLTKPVGDDEAQPTSPQVVTKVAATRLKAADVNSKAFREFVERAPDGSKAKHPIDSKWKLRGKKVVITVQLDPEQLQELDELVQELGTTRTELIRSLIRAKLEKVPRGN